MHGSRGRPDGDTRLIGRAARVEELRRRSETTGDLWSPGLPEVTLGPERDHNRDPLVDLWRRVDQRIADCGLRPAIDGVVTADFADGRSEGGEECDG